TSTSFCHYTNKRQERRLISFDVLRAGILWGMKENLTIQFVYPDYDIPQEYKDVIETIDHSKIEPTNAGDADVIVINDWREVPNMTFDATKVYVLRICKKDLFEQRNMVKDIFRKVARLNVVITDIETITESDFNIYKECLEEWSLELTRLYACGSFPQFNLLTDRMMLDKMNNCGAGVTNITLAPNGKFYICPAFYYDGECSGKEVSLGEVCDKGYRVGNLEEGLDIKNPQLYKLDYAPLCRICDAYQCKRCVWLNRKMTYEVNMPSHEQCVLSHIERNASRELLKAVRQYNAYLSEKDINEINYLDPFDVKKE
ncbi:MAG: CXXX repeat peptide maturase, partial [Bacteroidales bacterium]|nr:CXXX repeat peptide maturase [Bacteroidales bacterium]